MLEEFQSVFIQMAVLFIIVGVGYGAKKLHVIDADLDKKLSTLVLSTSLPALVLASVLAAETLPTQTEIVQTLLLAFGGFALLIAAALVVTFLLRVPVNHRGAYRFMLTFANSGFLGYPVITAIYGSDVLIYACIYNLPFNFLVFSVGVFFIASDNEKGVKVKMSWRDFVSPTIVASIVTIVLALLGVHDVPVLGESLETLGSMTTPMTLLIVGSSLANLPVRELLGGPRLAAMGLCRLLVMPLVTWAALHFFAEGMMLSMLVLLAGMPVATNGTMLCYRYGGDIKTMSQGTFVTTVLSLFTIPIITAVLV